MKQIMVIGMGVAVLVGCGSDDPPPSCQQAVTHYYESGCTLVDLSTGQAQPEGSVIAQCQQLLAGTPTRCAGEFDNLRVCWDSVPSHSTTNAQCDCSQEQDAVLSCQ